MPATLLASQFATLEPPVDAIDVDIRASVAVQVQAIVDALGLASSSSSLRRLATRPNRQRGIRECATRCARRPGRAMTESSRYRPATELAHLGRDPRRYLGAVSTPVFRASTILLPTVADLEHAARGEYHGLVLRPARPADRRPTCRTALATLEGGHAALVVPSGLTATTLPLLALLKPGDHLL